jgi:MGT family glycosyltransferase
MHHSLNRAQGARNMHVLLTTLPASGHVNPMIAIAQALVAAGHRVTMMTGPQYAEQITRAGIDFRALDYPPDDYEKLFRAFSTPLPRFPQLFWTRPHAAAFYRLGELTRALVDAIPHLQADVMLTDFNFCAGPIAAEACGLPYASFCAIVNALPSIDTPTFGARMAWKPPAHPLRWFWRVTRWGSRWYLRMDDWRVNQVRRKFGLGNVPFPMWYASPWLFIAMTSEAYEYPRRDLLAQAVYVGPVISSQRGDFPWQWLDDPRPTVFVSMGTIAQIRHVFARSIEAAQGADWKAVIVMGKGADLTQFGDVPENVLLQNFVPQTELLPKIDAVVSHGGNNTVTESLLHGKPLVVIPVTADQPESAGRVVKSGAGLRLDLRRVSSHQLRKAIDAILFDPQYRAAAARIQADFQKTNGAETIVRLLERLHAERAPLHRPEGFAPTLYSPDDVMGLITVPRSAPAEQ